MPESFAAEAEESRATGRSGIWDLGLAAAARGDGPKEGGELAELLLLVELLFQPLPHRDLRYAGVVGK